MMRKRLLALVLLCTLLLPLFPAQAASFKLRLVGGEAMFKYSFSISGEQYCILDYSCAKTSEKGRVVLYAADGKFKGKISLEHSPEGGKFHVKITNLLQKQLIEKTVDVEPAADYAPPQGTTLKSIYSSFKLKLEDSPKGFRYAFSAPGTDYVKLKVESLQERFITTVYPTNKKGDYAGEIETPLTYARTNIVVSVLNNQGAAGKKGEARKGYQAPEPPEAQEGRLSGVIVCIDPGHQESKKNFTPELIGPGLPGKPKSSFGMAQGKVTKRKEHIVALEISMKLRDELIRQGATVVMTREEPMQELTNLERCAIAEKAHAHIMLRIHLDNYKDTKYRGFHVYGPLNSEYAQKVADKDTYRQMGQLLLDALKRAAGFPTTGKDKNKYGEVRMNDAYIGNNWAKMACFLVETAYLSSPRDDVMASHPTYQQTLAEGMAQGVYDIAVYRGWVKGETSK